MVTIRPSCQEYSYQPDSRVSFFYGSTVWNSVLPALHEKSLLSGHVHASVKKMLLFH